MKRKIFKCVEFTIVFSLFLLLSFSTILGALEEGYASNGNITAIYYYCGDGICSKGENCKSCPEDCGACELINETAICGNGICEATETCSNCPSDCKCTVTFQAPITGLLTFLGGAWSLGIGVATILILVLVLFLLKRKEPIKIK